MAQKMTKKLQVGFCVIMSRNRDPFYSVKNVYKCAFYMRVLTDEKFLESIVLIFIIELGYYAKENEQKQG